MLCLSTSYLEPMFVNYLELAGVYSEFFLSFLSVLSVSFYSFFIYFLLMLSLSFLVSDRYRTNWPFRKFNDLFLRLELMRAFVSSNFFLILGVLIRSCI